MRFIKKLFKPFSMTILAIALIFGNFSGGLINNSIKAEAADYGGVCSVEFVEGDMYGGSVEELKSNMFSPSVSYIASLAYLLSYSDKVTVNGNPNSPKFSITTASAMTQSLEFHFYDDQMSVKKASGSYGIFELEVTEFYFYEHGMTKEKKDSRSKFDDMLKRLRLDARKKEDGTRFVTIQYRFGNGTNCYWLANCVDGVSSNRKVKPGSTIKVNLNKLYEYLPHLKDDTSLSMNIYWTVSEGGASSLKKERFTSSKGLTINADADSKYSLKVKIESTEDEVTYETPSIQIGKKDSSDKGSYLLDLSDGKSVSESIGIGQQICCTFSKTGSLLPTSAFLSNIYDLNNDGGADIIISIENGKIKFEKAETCTVEGTKEYVMPEVSANELDADGNPYYGKVTVKFTNPIEVNNPEVSADTGTAVAPEKAEKLDPSIKVPSVGKLEKTKKSIKISWKKPSKKALKKFDGYEIQCSTDKSFATVDKKTTVKKNKTSATIKKLTPGKKYYVRVRAYKNVNGEKVYSNWSKIKNAKLPKK